MKNNLLSIARIVDYIEVHLEEKLDLESVAKEAGYFSSSYWNDS